MDTLFDLAACTTATLEANPNDPPEVAEVRARHTNPVLFRRECAEKARELTTAARRDFKLWRKHEKTKDAALFGNGRMSTYEKHNKRASDLRKAVREADLRASNFARFAENELPEGDSIQAASEQRLEELYR